MSEIKKGREKKEEERKNEEEKMRKKKKADRKKGIGKKFEITASASASWFAQLQPAPGPRLL